MFLRELKIHGFKSFAKQTRISFGSGITAIVGPNGCGKSNIVDAIRWVLGEQNIRSLRGKQLTDIIFSGNHNEKNLNIAEVSLTLDNSKRILPLEMEEINIKRRIYRSGDTENYINEIPCRLREIQEIFMNTGLGKNTYSIIAQGEIDLILSAKPSERRYLFEEAASISKYKYEKIKTLKKINEIDNNLEKISNIILEIKDQLTILEREAKHLKEYKICREKIRNLELFLIYQKYNLYKTNLLKINKKNELYEKNTKNILLNIKKNESKINNLNRELNNLKKKKENYKFDNYKINNKKKSIQNELKLISQKKINFKKRIIGLSKEAEEIDNKITFYNKNKENINIIIIDINKKLNDMNRELNIFNEEFKQKSKYINLLNRNKNNSKKILEKSRKRELFLKEREIKYKTTLNILNLNLDKIRKKRKILENEMKEINRKKDDFQNAVIIRGQNIEKTKLEKNEEKIKNAEINLDRLQLFIEKTNQNIELNEERRDILKKSIKNYEYKNKEKIEEFCSTYYQEYPNGICKRLIKLINKIPLKYEKIIEITLREILNSIVVDNLSFALDTLNLIPKDGLKEINIIPMDLIKKRKTVFKKRDKIYDKSVCGFADKIINYNEKFPELFKALLSNILIVEDIQTALNYSKKYLGLYKIISLNGMVIDFDGSVKFYLKSKNKKENIFYLEREIEKLNKEIAIKKNQVLENGKCIEKYNNIYSSLTEENKKIKSLLQQKEKNNIDKINNINEITKSINELKNTLKNLLNDENSIIEEKRNVSKKYLVFEKKYNNISGYNKNILSAVAILDGIIDKKNNKLANIKKDINDIKNNILVNEEKLINLKEKIKDVSFYNNDYIYSLKEKKDLIAEYNRDYAETFKKIEEYNEQLNRLNLDISSQIKKEEDLKNTIQEKSNLLENTLIEKNSQEKLYEENKDAKYKQKILEVQYQEKYDNLENEITKNYNLAIEKLELYKNKSISRKEANQNIGLLRNAILEMGKINFDADNRYQIQLKRYNSLKEKYNDIYQAKKTLIKLISEIDQIAKERFEKIFNQVKKYFNEIFKKIFSGGEGKLYLNSEKDIMQSGIEIIARPPGKKTRNIELLSSGERALTAIALLLSLWKVNPSPFCFFDEIDTSLDESNAEKLAFLFKGKDLDHSQLIVITHQKSTMEAADTLYGVTMEESGISKLVSVKFKK